MLNTPKITTAKRTNCWQTCGKTQKKGPKQRVFQGVWQLTSKLQKAGKQKCCLPFFAQNAHGKGKRRCIAKGQELPQCKKPKVSKQTILLALDLNKIRGLLTDTDSCEFFVIHSESREKATISGSCSSRAKFDGRRKMSKEKGKEIQEKRCGRKATRIVKPKEPSFFIC